MNDGYLLVVWERGTDSSRSREHLKFGKENQKVTVDYTYTVISVSVGRHMHEDHNVNWTYRCYTHHTVSKNEQYSNEIHLNPTGLANA